MTDESDRMDRARRIREMREGTRQADRDPGDRGTDADTESGSGDDPPVAGDDTDDLGSADGDGDPGSADDTREDAEGSTEGTRDDAGGSIDDTGGSIDDAGGSQDDPGEPEDHAPLSAADSGSDGSESDTLRIPGADLGDVDVDPAELAREAGLDAMGVDEPASEADDDGVVTDSAAAPGARAAGNGSSGDETRVLEFDLGAERYCLDIDYVEEIVKRDTVTRVPNTPDFVAGVVDLRGQITTILDPKRLLDIDAEGPANLLVVFDPNGFEDQGAIGWIVDDVNQVTPIAEEEVNDSPVDQDHVEGIVDRDGEFVIWTTPELALDETAG